MALDNPAVAPRGLPFIHTIDPPYNVDPSQTAALNLTGINLAIADADTEDNSKIVLLPPGTINIDGPVIVRAGTRLWGVGSAAANENGTVLFLAAGSDTNVIQDEFWVTQGTNWVHNLEIAYLRIDGNKANNTGTLAGIAIWQMGETADIHHVLIRACNTYGIDLPGTHAPLHISGPVSISKSGTAAVRAGSDGDSHVGAAHFNNFSGDDNQIFFSISKITCLITGLKCEKTHDPVIDVYDGGAVTLEGLLTSGPEGASKLTRIIRVEDDTCQVRWSTCRAFDYTNVLVDTNSGFTIPHNDNIKVIPNLEYYGNRGTLGVGVSAIPYGDGHTHITKLTLGATSVLPDIVGGAAEAEGLLVFTFPAGVILVEAVHMDVSITQTDGFINADTPKIGVGSVIATGAVSVLNGTAGFDDYVVEQTAANCTGTKTDKTELTAVGNKLIEAGGVHAVHLNVADTWAANGDDAAILGGDIWIAWEFLGA